VKSLSKLLTFDIAKGGIERLTYFDYLVENYEVNNIEEWIIKEYSMKNQIPKVVKSAYGQGKER
jgi:hypothetical protein